MYRQLGVNLDSMALLRQWRGMETPDPILFAGLAEAAGAAHIQVHLRSDRLHIQPRDIRLLRETVKTSLILRMAPTQEMLQTAYDIKPREVIFVPEPQDERSPELGLDIQTDMDLIRKYIAALRDAEIIARVFVEADVDQVRAAHRAEAQSIVLDTGKLTDAKDAADIGTAIQRIDDAARTAHKLGMRVAASNRLNHHNVRHIRQISAISEIHAGHGIVSQALLTGFESAVRQMLEAIQPY